MNADARSGEFHGQPFYEERQRFGVWAYGILVLVLASGAMAQIAVYRGGGAKAEGVGFGVAFYIWIVILLISNLLLLKTTVDARYLQVSLGALFPMMRKKIAMSDITSMRVVQYRPLRDAGGWGMRFGRFDGKGTTFWNARGDRGVLVETAKRPYVIGSQDPEALYAAIERARKGVA